VSRLILLDIRADMIRRGHWEWGPPVTPVRDNVLLSPARKWKKKILGNH